MIIVNQRYFSAFSSVHSPGAWFAYERRASSDKVGLEILQLPSAEVIAVTLVDCFTYQKE